MYANVERYFPDRGFGFAVMRDEQSIYFHISSFCQPPEAVEYGDLLQFDTISTPRGLRAVRIELIPCQLPEEGTDHAG